MKVKKGDTVKIITGAHKGKEGAVIQSLPLGNKVVVEGVNVVKKHVKQKGIIEKTLPIHVSNVKKVNK